MCWQENESHRTFIFKKSWAPKTSSETCLPCTGSSYTGILPSTLQTCNNWLPCSLLTMKSSLFNCCLQPSQRLVGYMIRPPLHLYFTDINLLYLIGAHFNLSDYRKPGCDYRNCRCDYRNACEATRVARSSLGYSYRQRTQENWLKWKKQCRSTPPTARLEET